MRGDALGRSVDQGAGEIDRSVDYLLGGAERAPSEMDEKLIATDVVAASSRSGWAPGIDLRLVTNAERGVFAIGDGFGPTYGGHYYPLALDPALDAVATVLAGSDLPGLEPAFAEAQRIAYTLSLRFDAARIPKRGLDGERRAALSVRPDLANGTRDLFHTAVGISLVRLRSATLQVGQVGMSRVYVSRGSDIKLCVLDHSLPSEILRRHGEASPEYRSAIELHRTAVTRMLGFTSDCVADYSAESVSDSDNVLLCSAGVWNQPRGAFLIPALFRAGESAFAEVVADACSSSKIDAGAIRFRVARGRPEPA